MTVSCIFVAMFLALIGYLVYFNIYRKEEFLNSAYNSRQKNYAERVVRGSILASDGTELAKTETDEEGNERRIYPFDSLFAHVVGYTGKGNSGLESAYNYMLLESHMGPVEQFKNEMKDEKNIGDNIRTTLDVNLQQAASDALGDYKGAVVVLETETGRVLANVSKPTFNPNTIADDWEALNADSTSGVFLNRGLQGQYPPGSTFKIVTALAYLRQNGTGDGFSYECQGTLEQSGFTIHCAGNQAHGSENFADAFANSCNTAFSTIGLSLDRNDFMKLAGSLYLTGRVELELPTSKSSFLVDASMGDPLMMQTSIGQGNTLVTPLEMAMITAAAANGGEMMRPYFVDKIESANGSTVKSFSPESMGKVMSEGEAAALQELMKGVVNNGTAGALSDLGFSVGGKTGSAEHGDNSEPTHSWFVGFADTEYSDITVAVIAESAGSGGAVAVPVAHRIFEAYYGG